MIYSVQVKPGSKKDPLVMETPDGLVVYLREKPIDGEANTALVKLLSKHFGVTKSQISIKRGDHSRSKIVEIIS